MSTNEPTLERDLEDIEDEREWRADRKAKRLTALAEAMPTVFRRPGELHADAQAWVDALADGGRANLALVGGTGSGKSWHAWHAAQAALEAGWDGRIEVVTADEFRARTAPGPGREHLAAIDWMRTADLLVLDDIGANRATDWWLESMYAVINHRSEWLLPTVLTSNVANLRTVLEERLASRLVADVVTVVLSGPDRRRA